MLHFLDVQFTEAASTAPNELHPISTCCLHHAGLEWRLDVLLQLCETQRGYLLLRGLVELVLTCTLTVSAAILANMSPSHSGPVPRPSTLVTDSLRFAFRPRAPARAGGTFQRRRFRLDLLHRNPLHFHLPRSPFGQLLSHFLAFFPTRPLVSHSHYCRVCWIGKTLP